MVKVSDLCQGCLAHPLHGGVPQERHRLGVRPFHHRPGEVHQVRPLRGRVPLPRIVKTERPCATACGMGAIHSDALGRAEIDYSKCVSCGQCLVNCPFGAIADKGQIYS